MIVTRIKLYQWENNWSRGPPVVQRLDLRCHGLLCQHSQTTYLNSRSKMEDKAMKRILMTAGLLITLLNVGAGIAYACKCYEGGVLACETSGSGVCYHDAGGKCHCEDDIIIG